MRTVPDSAVGYTRPHTVDGGGRCLLFVRQKAGPRPQCVGSQCAHYRAGPGCGGGAGR